MTIRIGTLVLGVAALIALCYGNLAWGFGLMLCALIMRIIEN